MSSIGEFNELVRMFKVTEDIWLIMALAVSVLGFVLYKLTRARAIGWWLTTSPVCLFVVTWGCVRLYPNIWAHALSLVCALALVNTFWAQFVAKADFTLFWELVNLIAYTVCCIFLVAFFTLYALTVKMGGNTMWQYFSFIAIVLFVNFAFAARITSVARSDRP